MISFVQKISPASGVPRHNSSASICHVGLKQDVFQKDISFQGLSKDLGKKLYEDVPEVGEVSLKNPKSKEIVGSLPPNWIQQIPFSERKETIQKLYKDLTVVPYVLRKYDFSPKAIKKADKKLTKAFQDAGLVDKKQKVSLKKLGNGSVGYGFLIEGLKDNQNYVMKVFHAYGDYNRQAGPYIEMNRAMYWKKQAGSNTQRAEFYFGDLKSGYMVTQYIDESTPKPKRFVNPILLGIIPKDDMGENRISGYNIDYGYLDKYGMTIAKDKLVELCGVSAENKNSRYAFRRIFNSEDTEAAWKELTCDNKFKKKADIKAGLVLALDFVENPQDKYWEIFSNSNKFSNPAEYIALKKALAQKIEFAPQEKIEECCEDLLMAGDGVVNVLKNKTHYIKDEEVKKRVEKMVDAHRRLASGYGQYGAFPY